MEWKAFHNDTQYMRHPAVNSAWRGQHVLAIAIASYSSGVLFWPLSCHYDQYRIAILVQVISSHRSLELCWPGLMANASAHVAMLQRLSGLAKSNECLNYWWQTKISVGFLCHLYACETTTDTSPTMRRHDTPPPPQLTHTYTHTYRRNRDIIADALAAFWKLLASFEWRSYCDDNNNNTSWLFWLKPLIVLRDSVHACPVVTLSLSRGPWCCLTFPADLVLSSHHLASRGNAAWKRTDTACLTHTWSRLMTVQIFIIILPNSFQIWPWARTLPSQSTD